HIAEKRRLVILSRPVHVLHMAADRTRRDRPKPFGMIDKSKIFLNLDMSHVVPITDVRRGDFIEQWWNLPLRRDLFITTSPLDSKTYIFLRGPFNDRLEAFLHPDEMHRRRLLARSHGVDFFSNIFARKQPAVLRQRN